MAKNVVVYRDGKVFADGVEMSQVREVNAPTFPGPEPGHMIIDITGRLVFEDCQYTPMPQQANLTDKYWELKQRVLYHIKDGTERLILDGLP